LWHEARDLAESAVASAERYEFDGVLARAAAALASVCRACGDLEGEGRYRVRALRALLRTQDYLAACGLFGTSQRARLDDATVEAVVERTCLIVPQTINDGPLQAAAVRELVREILARGFDRFRPRRLLVDAAERVRTAGSAFASYAPPATGALEEMLSLVLVALDGRRCWSGRFPGLREVLATTNATFADCRPTGLLVGFPSAR
jgi:hypothetical protein